LANELGVKLFTGAFIGVKVPVDVLIYVIDPSVYTGLDPTNDDFNTH